MVLADRVAPVAAEVADLGGDPTRWVRQMKAAHADPQLRAAQAAHMAQVEAGIAAGLAERLGTDPESRCLIPMLLASAATGVLRATMSFWAASGGACRLDQLIDAAYQAMADGFPEDCALRTVAGAGADDRPGTRRESEHQSTQPARLRQDGKDQIR